MSVLDPALAWDVRCIYLFIHLSLKSLCGGGVPSSHPSLGLSVFFLSFFFGLRGVSGFEDDRRENDESGTTARWHEGCSENRRGTEGRLRREILERGRRPRVRVGDG